MSDVSEFSEASDDVNDAHRVHRVKVDKSKLLLALLCVLVVLCTILIVMVSYFTYKSKLGGYVKKGELNELLGGEMEEVVIEKEGSRVKCDSIDGSYVSGYYNTIDGNLVMFDVLYERGKDIAVGDGSAYLTEIGGLLAVCSGDWCAYPNITTAYKGQQNILTVMNELLKGKYIPLNKLIGSVDNATEDNVLNSIATIKHVSNQLNNTSSSINNVISSRINEMSEKIDFNDNKTMNELINILHTMKDKVK